MRTTMTEQVEAALAALDQHEADLAEHPAIFEAVNDAILAELDQLEGL
ncbi:MAG TPA: hypothetical protein VF995_10790 [Actinomycetota bacterium]